MTMSSRTGVFSRLWFSWKSLNLPWRRQRLVGYDLDGNTFWEFRDALYSNRMRRIVKYNRHTHHSDVKITPQWHQWLRHTRIEPPSIRDQQFEVMRQGRMKQLAAEADARWASQPSFLDKPKAPQAVAASAESQPAAKRTETQQVETKATDKQTPSKSAKEDKFKPKLKNKDPNPFGRPQTGAPGEDWQPQSWTPNVAAKR